MRPKVAIKNTIENTMYNLERNLSVDSLIKGMRLSKEKVATSAKRKRFRINMVKIAVILGLRMAMM